VQQLLDRLQVSEITTRINRHEACSKEPPCEP
jgi:hypothetical protein